MKKVISSNNAPSAIGPYSQAIWVNGTLYISGQIPINPNTGEVIVGIEEETHQVMKNIQAILNEVGMDFSNVVKSSIFLKNMEDFSIVNDIYSSYLEAPYPARETIQVVALPKNVNIEISMIAHQEL